MKYVKQTDTTKFGILIIFITLLAAACTKNVETPSAATSVPASLFSTQAEVQVDLNTITVYKSPTCGCCSEWEEHLRSAGFKVDSIQRRDMHSIKAKYGIKSQLSSCHTAVIGDYVIEGHVPTADIEKLLQQKPKIRGLAAPGMPQHSPGMQPHSHPPRDYDVLSFTAEGNISIFTSY